MSQTYKLVFICNHMCNFLSCDKNDSMLIVQFYCGFHPYFQESSIFWFIHLQVIPSSIHSFSLFFFSDALWMPSFFSLFLESMSLRFCFRPFALRPHVFFLRSITTFKVPVTSSTLGLQFQSCPLGLLILTAAHQSTFFKTENPIPSMLCLNQINFSWLSTSVKDTILPRPKTSSYLLHQYS